MNIISYLAGAFWCKCKNNRFVALSVAGYLLLILVRVFLCSIPKVSAYLLDVTSGLTDMIPASLFMNTYSSISAFIAATAGIIGFVYVIVFLYYLVAKQNFVDKTLADFKFSSVIKVLLFLICFPCTIGLLNCLIGVLPSDLLVGLNNNMDSSNLNHEDHLSPDIFWTTFYHFTDPGNQHMVGTATGRQVAWWIAILGLFLMNGFMVSTIINYIDRHISGWTNGQVRYHFWHSSHIIIIGGHDSVSGIINEVTRDGGKYQFIKYIIIMTSQDVETYRVSLKSCLPEPIMDKIILYHGERTSIEDLRSLNVCYKSLKAIYVVGEGDDHINEAAHDSQNLTCVKILAQLVNKNIERYHKKYAPQGGTDKNYLDCYMMFEEQSTYTAFQLTDISKDIKLNLNFIPYNYYEQLATKILAYPESPIRAIDIHYDDQGTPLSYMDEDSDKRVHLVIFGMTDMGLAIAQEAALICHYPNYSKQEMMEEIQLSQHVKQLVSSNKGSLRTKITLIDRDAYRLMNNFRNREKSLFAISKWSYLDATAGYSDFIVHDSINRVASILRQSTKNIVDSPDPVEDAFEYKHLIESNLLDANFTDVEWEFIQGEPGDTAVNYYLDRCNEKQDEILTIFICEKSDSENLAIATNLPQRMYSYSEQVLVYQRRSNDLVNQLAGTNVGDTNNVFNRYKKVSPFGNSLSSFSQELADSVFAKKINSNHYNQIRKLSNQKDLSSVQWVWGGLKQRDRWSAIYSGHGWTTKFRSIHCLPGEKPDFERIKTWLAPNSLSSDLASRTEHTRWIYERIIMMGENLMTDSSYKEWVSKSNAVQDDNCLSERERFKRELKSGLMKEHLDICSNWQLKTKDKASIIEDTKRLCRLVDIYEALF